MTTFNDMTTMSPGAAVTMHEGDRFVSDTMPTGTFIQIAKRREEEQVYETVYSKDLGDEDARHALIPFWWMGMVSDKIELIN